MIRFILFLLCLLLAGCEAVSLASVAVQVVGAAADAATCERQGGCE